MFDLSHKKCRRCLEVKPREDFSKAKACLGRISNICRICDATKRSKHRKRNRLQSLVKSARTRAAVKGIPFDLDYRKLIVPEFCPVLSIPLAFGTNNKTEPGSPSIDRLVPELGYIQGNVTIISAKANTIKSYGTAEDHEKIAAWMRNK